MPDFYVKASERYGVCAIVKDVPTLEDAEERMADALAKGDIVITEADYWDDSLEIDGDDADWYDEPTLEELIQERKALFSDQKSPAIPNRNPAEGPNTTAYDAFFGIDNIVHIVIEAENEEQALEKAKQLLKSDDFEQTITESGSLGHLCFSLDEVTKA